MNTMKEALILERDRLNRRLEKINKYLESLNEYVHNEGQEKEIILQMISKINELMSYK